MKSINKFQIIFAFILSFLCFSVQADEINNCNTKVNFDQHLDPFFSDLGQQVAELSNGMYIHNIFESNYMRHSIKAFKSEKLKEKAGKGEEKTKDSLDLKNIIINSLESSATSTIRGKPTLEIVIGKNETSIDEAVEFLEDLKTFDHEYDSQYLIYLLELQKAQTQESIDLIGKLVSIKLHKDSKKIEALVFQYYEFTFDENKKLATSKELDEKRQKPIVIFNTFNF